MVEEEYRLGLVTAEADFVRRFLVRIAEWRPLWAGFHQEGGQQ
jgi:hypothetical protein